MEEKSSEDHDERGGKSMFSGEAGLSRPTAIGNCDDDEVDSGAESDDIDLLELGEVGVEFCLVEDQTCSIPLELYDLLDLSDVLSLDVWNECLSEEDRFELAKYLPDMDEVTFMWTLKDLLSGDDFHFGNPVHRLFEMMKGGLCEPRVALYRQGLNMLQKCKHYHQLRKYQNNMVSSLYQIRDVWITCRGYSIEEKLHKLNLVRSQKTLMYEKTNDIGLDGASLGRDDPDGDIWSQTLMETKVRQKKGSHFDYQENSGHLSGKQKCKALLNLAEPITLAKQPACYPPYVQYGSSSAIPKHNKKARYGMNPFLGEKKEAEEVIYNAAMQRNTDAAIRYVSEVHKSRKRHGCLRGDELSSLNFKGIPLMNGDTHQVNQLSDITVLTTKPSNGGALYDFGKKMSYFGNIHAYTGRSKIGGNCKNQVPGSAALLGSQGGISDPSEHFQRRKYQPEAFMRNQLAQDKWDTCRKTPQMKRNSLDLDMMSQINDEAPPAPLANYRAEFSAEYMGGNCVQNGAPDITALRGKSISQSDETESDSSKHVEEESNLLWNREFPYPDGTGSISGDFGFENVNYLTKKNFMKGDLGENAHLDMQIVETCSKKVKRNSAVVKANHLKDILLRVTEDEIISDKGASNNNDSKRKKFVLGKTRNLLGGLGESSIALEEYPLDVGPKTANECDPSLNLSNQLNECGASGHDLLEADELVGGLGAQEASAKKRRSKEITGYERAKSYQGCSQLEKKQKRKGKGICMGPQDKYDHLHSDPQRTPVPENVEETETGSQVLETSDPQYTEMELIDAELEAKAQRTRFTLITPTVHSGLPFSVIHLLSAVRVVMTTPQPEDTLVVSQPIEEGMQQVVENAENHENANNFVPQVHGRVPTLTIQEIVNRVRSNPGDPCILETDEPLQDLVRGVLKVFSSRKGTLGAKDWKPLAAYRKSTKSWYWIGSVLQSSSSDQETTEEVTSPDAWGIPRKILVKLVDSFANWLVSSQEVLQQLGTLPAPPASLCQLKLEEKDRFKDQRAQKSACTFEPSSAEVRDYFRLEEALRYSIPDRAFAYTAADGSKSMVAPLRRCGGGGKPTSKPRDHFLLKPDRPPHVTILCLVRDAAARLPGCVGTRSDICTLMRDSQYIVEDFPDSQMNQIVSGALDRLHYEHDPCVRYENDRKIWVYLHRERTEEDFEDDGTSSTRRWKRPPKKDPDQVASSAALDLDHAEEETVGGSEKCDYNVEPSACVDEEDIIVDIM